ncbi:MAG: hypothetical protein P9L95_10430 [Candidatus Tenebribacter mawsonii]|nr:hypothetical protein [Candidatus Tenebribacter mawsonii]
MKILKNNNGYSLIEIIAGLPLVTLVFVIFGIGIIHFTTTFQEVKLYTQLQQDLFDAIEIMRHGYMYENVTDDEGLIGLTTAKKAVIGTSRNSIKVTPLVLNLNLEERYWVTYAVNDDSQLEINGQYGLTSFPERKTIFPSSPAKYIGNQAQFRITNPNQIWDVIHRDAEGNATMVKIKLVGQVRFREKESRQSNEDDVRKNTRTITYETAVFLGNSHAATE